MTPAPILAAGIVAALAVAGVVLTWRATAGRGTVATWMTPARLLAVGYVGLLAVGSVVVAGGGGMTGPLLVGLAVLAIGLGTVLGARVGVRAGALPVVRVDEPAPGGRLRRDGVALALGAFGILAFGLIAVEHGLPLLTSDPQGSRAGFQGLRLDLFRWLAPPAALLAVVDALTSRRRTAIVVAGIGTGAVIGLELLAASRTLPFEFGLAALVLWIRSGRRVTRAGWIATSGVAGLVFLGVLFARVGPGGGFSGPLDAILFATDRTIGRVVLIQPRATELITTIYPDEEPYLAGSSYLRWVDRLAGREPPPSLASTLFARMFPEEPPGGFVAPGVLGEGYANFGPIFALALVAGLGVLAAVLGRIAPRIEADAAGRVLVALLMVALLRTYATSLLGFLVTFAAAIAWWSAVALPIPRSLTRRRS